MSWKKHEFGGLGTGDHPCSSSEVSWNQFPSLHSEKTTVEKLINYFAASDTLRSDPPGKRVSPQSGQWFV